LCYPSFHKNLVPKFPTDGATFFGNFHMKLFLFGCRGRCFCIWIVITNENMQICSFSFTLVN
jgi:hypothetical protein